MVLSSRLSLKLATLALGATVFFVACGKNKGTVHFGNLEDGAQVESPFKVEMKAENLVVEAAANGVVEGHGHFHILVDVPVPMSLDPIPNNAQHIHYGQGQTETMLDLPVGEHTLTLQFAKGDHRPYDPQITQTIKVMVTRRNAPAVDAGEVGTNGMSDTAGNGADSTQKAPSTQVLPPTGGGGTPGNTGVSGGGM